MLMHAMALSGASKEVGSVSAMYDLLVQASKDTPVVGNQDGSYMTMKSNQGLVFGAATILSGDFQYFTSSFTMLDGLIH